MEHLAQLLDAATGLLVAIAILVAVVKLHR